APVQSMELEYHKLRGLLTQGGTILGTANRGRFSAKTGAGEVRGLPRELLLEAKRTVDEMSPVGLVCVGGDGTLTIAQQLHEFGVPVVGVPKTIDNDLAATVTTFGFDSAVACATEALDRLQTTAESHNRVMVLEVMGRHAGWIAVHAGIAGGGDVILIPEIPFRYESICAKIAQRAERGRRFTLVVVAEGAKEAGGQQVAHAGPADGKDGEIRLGGIGAAVAREIERRTGQETRVCVLGHLQRGGGPTCFDRLLCTRFGTKAVQLVADKEFGMMVSLQPPDTRAVKITDAIGRIRQVPIDGDLVRTARALGVSFGDGTI
ncbi:MAG: ATP-dependent 6-phosphofructokinase, partial [Planctomycetes bacterium]|nr:ATP-dependent 6-phosphofructokinase [Planctomycetota bacterium]